jgi:hypothetical protein
VPVDIAQVVAETLEMVRGTLPAAVRLEPTAAASPLLVIGDATQLHQVVMNLCSNAMRDGGALHVTLESADLGAECLLSHGTAGPGRHVRLGVEDTGSGIAEATLSHVFEPLFTTKEPGQAPARGRCPRATGDVARSRPLSVVAAASSVATAFVAAAFVAAAAVGKAAVGKAFMAYACVHFAAAEMPHVAAEMVVRVAVEVIVAAAPRTGPDEGAAFEPFRPVVAVGSAGIGRVAIEAVLAAGLGLGLGGGTGQAGAGDERQCEVFESVHESSFKRFEEISWWRRRTLR